MNGRPSPYAEDGRIKIAQIIGDAALGGVAACLLNYYRFMDRGRYRFDFFTYGPSSFDERLHAVDKDARVFTIPRLDTRFYKAVPALTRALREGGYAVVHSHMTTLSAFALRAADKAGAAVRICHAHSTFDKQSDHYFVKAALRPFAARRATALMACGKLAAQNLYRERADEAVILPNAIDLERFVPGGEAEKRALGLSGRVLLFVGRFAPQKNLLFLLEAFAKARKEMPMTLVLVGAGPQRGPLDALAAQLKIGRDVRFVPPCDPAPYYAAADAFCLPSLYEGLPVVGLEAQAAGLHCLFSDKVTEDADAAHTAAFLPLDADAWAAAMRGPLPKRADGADKLRAAGYDIRREAARLPAFYDEQLRRAGLTL